MSSQGIPAINLARTLIRHNTVSPPGAETECARFIGGILQESGFSVEYYDFAPDRTSLVARRSGRTQTRLSLCFTGHIDTVPLGSLEWNVDPFGAEIRDGKLFGRGSSDMKSGIAAFMTAITSFGTKLVDG